MVKRMKHLKEDFSIYKETKGIIEIGSTSTQIAFAPSSNTNLPNEYSSEVSINGENYKIYATSYLCLGKEEYMRRYYAELVRVSLVESFSTPYSTICFDLIWTSFR